MLDAAAASSRPEPGPFTLRQAVPADITQLLRLENRCFESDRLTRRNFQYLLRRGHAQCVVAERDGVLLGYALVLLRSGTSLARLYSIAVSPEARGQGVGKILLQAAANAAIDGGAMLMRLEVRPDNEPAIRLYREAGYREFGRYLDYYEDHAAALRFERRLTAGLPPRECRTPYYPQTTSFTCGPAALLMAMRALDPAVELTPRHEFQIWREATTIFMAAGHGGCDPYGLALAADRRGFAATIYVNDHGYLFLDGVRNELKKHVMRLVQDDFRAQVAAAGIAVLHRPLTHAELTNFIDQGAMPIVLISLFRMYRERVPHWLVVHGHDDRFIYAHDPWIEPEEMDTAAAKANLPIPLSEFDRMARFGRTNLRAAVIVSRRPTP